MAPPPDAPAAERAYAYTKDLILTGGLAGGQLISEGRICAELGVSRTPVHEAFLRLDAERLLALSSRKGAVVAPMAPQEARDVLEMREAIESSAARRLTADGAPGEAVLARLGAHLARQREHADAGDVDAFVEADDAFHSEVVTASGNTLAAHFTGLLRDRQQRLRRQLLTLHREAVPVVLAEHRQLLARLAAADGDGYATLLAAHVAHNHGAL